MGTAARGTGGIDCDATLGTCPIHDPPPVLPTYLPTYYLHPPREAERVSERASERAITLRISRVAAEHSCARETSHARRVCSSPTVPPSFRLSVDFACLFSSSAIIRFSRCQHFMKIAIITNVAEKPFFKLKLLYCKL